MTSMGTPGSRIQILCIGVSLYIVIHNKILVFTLNFLLKKRPKKIKDHSVGSRMPIRGRRIGGEHLQQFAKFDLANPVFFQLLKRCDK
jgi:hypothetical protein